MLKKYLAVFLTIALLAVMLVACGGGDSGSTSADSSASSSKSEDSSAAPVNSESAENTTFDDSESTDSESVEIRAAWWGDTVRNDMYSEIVSRFVSANSGITVVCEPMSWSDYWDKLQIQSASGTAPDYMGMHPQFAADYLRRGVLEPLTQYINDGIIDESKFSDSARETGFVDGVQYTFPMGISFTSCFVNVSFLEDELGITTIPDRDWTWDDLKTYGLEVREELDAKGLDSTYVFSDISDTFGHFRFYVRMFGQEAFDDDGEITFDPEYLEDYFARYDELRQLRIIPDAATVTEYAGTTLEDSMFSRDKVVFHIVPVNQYKLYCTTFPDKRIEILRIPSMEGKPAPEFPEGAQFAISSKTTPEKKEAAAKLMNFWLGSEESYELYGLDQGVPGNMEMADYIETILDEYQKPIMSFAKHLFEVSTAGSIYPPAGITEIDAAFVSAAEAVRFGTKTPNEAAEDFFQEAEAIVEKSR